MNKLNNGFLNRFSFYDVINIRKMKSQSQLSVSKFFGVNACVYPVKMSFDRLMRKHSECLIDKYFWYTG